MGTSNQIKTAEELLNNFRHRRFLPVNEACHDQARQDLDRAILVDLLHLPKDTIEGLDVRQRQWCTEPSVHGRKDTRP